MDPRVEQQARRIRELEALLEARSLRGRVRRALRWRFTPWLAFAAIFLPAAAFAPLTLPYVFVNGTVADADQVNANFNAVVNEIQINADALLSHQADPTAHGVDGLAAEIAANDAELASQLNILNYLGGVVPSLADQVNDVENDVAGIQSTLTSLAVDVSGNTADIAALQAAVPGNLNDAVCTKADADGDIYRPYTCDPRCDCLGALPSAAQAGIAACTETTPGEYTIEASYTGPPTPGTCALLPNACNPVPELGWSVCSDVAWGQSCSTQADCGPQTACVPVPPNNFTLCIPDPCTDDASCNPPTVCTNLSAVSPSCNYDFDCGGFWNGCSSGCTFGDPISLCSGFCVPHPCNTLNDCFNAGVPTACFGPGLGCFVGGTSCDTDADCAAGEHCAPDVDGSGSGVCLPGCATNDDCGLPSSLVLADVALSGVAAANSPAVVQCTATDGSTTVFSGGINSNDALDCIADAEAVLGQACTPAP